MILWVAGGFIAVVTLLLTWKRGQDNRSKLQLEKDSNFTDHYTEAVTQLGSEKSAIRLGGVYALERIAKDSERDHDVIVQVLAAFIRLDGAQRDRRDSLADDRPEDVTAAITVAVGLTMPADTKVYLDFSGADLTHTNLSGANLAGADLTGANVTGARRLNS